MSGAGVRPGHSYHHEAFFHRGDAEYLAGTVPMIRNGVAAGAVVMVAVPLPRLEQLRAALGSDGDHVAFLDTTDLSRNPTRILGAWADFLDAARRDGLPALGIGEPVWSGRSHDEIAEYQLHEALVNLAVPPDSRVWLRCPYDADELDDDLLEEAQRSHPFVTDGSEVGGSTSYGGGHHAAVLLSSPLPEPPEVLEELVFGARDLRHVRTAVRLQAKAAGVRRERRGDLELAVHELAANSVRHGGGSGCLRIWRSPEGLRCDISDAGVISDPLVGRRGPDADAEGGRGLWVANKLCDLVQLRSSPAGTTVRVLAKTAS